MKIPFKDSKPFIVASVVILVLIVSGIGYGWIAREEARTGGIGEKWHMATSETNWIDTDAIQPNGAMLITDSDSHLISMVDKDGSVEWTHNYGDDLVFTKLIDDDLFMIDVSDNGQYSLDCISLDGIWKSTVACPPIYSFLLGEDGRVYASGHADNRSTIYCIEGGSIKWSDTQNGSLWVEKVWNDGRVLLHHMNYRQEMINSSYTTVIQENKMILLSNNGTSIMTLPFPTEGSYYGTSVAIVASNGTIILIREYGVMDGKSVRISQGYSDTGSLLWSTNESYQTVIRTIPYYGCQPCGEYVESVYKVDPSNYSNSWEVLLNNTWGGTIYDLEDMEIFFSSNGEAYGLNTNGSILWHIDTGVTSTAQCAVDHDHGLLLLAGNTIEKINRDGSFWTYDGIDSTIKGARFGPDGTIYVMTSDKLVALYKPTVSTPTEYLIAMLSVDLLIILSSTLWVADWLMPKPSR